MNNRYRMLWTVALMGGCASNEFESGEAAVCLGNDEPAPIPVTAKANWEVTGMVDAVRDFDASDSANTNCSSAVSTAVDVVDATGTTWTLGYGILDSKGNQELPQLDLIEGETINLIVRQNESGLSRGFVIHDGQGVVAAMDEGIAGGALNEDDVNGLIVARGLPIGTSKDDCGKMEGTQIAFEGTSKVTTSPFNSTYVEIDDTELQAFAIDSFYWTKTSCTDAEDKLAWAVFR